MSAAEPQPLTLGTAGHIDHGKTALVRALTGIDTDRLAQEKERGITIELGFAHLELGGRRCGVVDVPGHERFIRAMVSGATGIDLVCLVIAADEGVMPQTREHLDICQLLGVGAGVVALTKVDRVEAEWVEAMREEVQDALQGTFLESAPLVPCSARTGAGMDALRQALEQAAAALPARKSEGALRLPVDRVFTIRGFGTVVTGTVRAGRLELGDELEVLPSGHRTKVRGIQIHGQAASAAEQGSRAAVNLAGIEVAELSRGDVLSHAGALLPSHILDVELSHLGTSVAPLGRRQRVLIHHGTTQVLGNVHLLEGQSLAPGETAVAQLRIDRDTPLVAVPGDHFLLRGFVPQKHYGTTIGGGVVLRVLAAKKRVGSADADAMRALKSAGERQRVADEIAIRRHRGLAVDELARRLGLRAEELSDVVAAMAEAGEIVACGPEGSRVLVSPEALALIEARIRELVGQRDGPTPLAEIAERLPDALPSAVFEVAVAALCRRDELVRDGSELSLAKARAPLSPLARELAERFEGWRLQPPRPKDLAAERGRDPSAIDGAVRELLDAGALVKVKHDLLVHANAISALRDALISHLDSHGEITPQQWKQLTGTSRKFSIPLAEYFDQEKLTLRVGNVRKRRG